MVWKVALIAMVLWGGCGDDNERTVARIQITPGAVLLGAPGETQTLTVAAIDTDGRAVPLPGAVTWTSNKPDVVEVSANGELIARAELASAQITARVGDFHSDPIVVLVAKLKPGTLLVDDAQIASEYIPNADLTQYEVILRDIDAPEPGTIVIGRQGESLVGRVASAMTTGDGTRLVLDVIPLSQAFAAIAVDEQFALPRGALEAPGTSPKLVRARRPADPSTFSLGPFECESSVEPKINVGVPISFTLEPDIDFDYKFQTADDEVQLLRMVAIGELAVKLEAALETTAAFGAEITCERDLATVVLPLGGPLSFIIAPVFTFGVGMSSELAIEVAQFKAGIEGRLGGKLTSGFEYTKDNGVDLIGDIEKIAEVEGKVETANLSADDLRAKLAIQPHGYVKLSGQVLPRFKIPELKGDLFGVKLGVELELDYATMAAQVASEDYASAYTLTYKSSLGLEDDATDFLKLAGGLIEITPPELEFALPISRSPQGTFSISKRNLDAGDVATFEVQLDPDTVTWLFSDNVEAVEVYRDEPTTGLTKFLTLGHQGGSRYAADWATTDNDIGSYQFAAFVRPVFGSELPMLEVDDNAVQTAVISDPGMPPPSLTGYWRFRVLSSGDCATNPGGYYEDITLFPNGGAIEDSFGNGTCTSANGDEYVVGNWSWTGSETMLQLQLCEYDTPEPGEEMVMDLSWNPVTQRMEGTLHRGPMDPYPPYAVCGTKVSDVNFTGSCAARGCPRANTTCTGINGGPGGYPGVALYCGCNSSICAECENGPPPWELAYTPDCW